MADRAVYAATTTEAFKLTAEVVHRAAARASPYAPEEVEHSHPCPFAEPERDCPFEMYSIHVRNEALSTLELFSWQRRARPA